MNPDATKPHLDGWGRRINYLRLSVTDLCNLRCFYCMPEGIINKLNHCDVLRFEESLEVVRAAADVGVNKIRITGGEPLVKKDIVYFTKQIAKISGINTVVMTTNGLRLAKYAPALKEAGLQRLNVSLDSLDPKVFSKITRGGVLSKVIEGIDRALELGFPIKINVVLLQDINTYNLYEFVEFCKTRDIAVRFIERMGFDEDKPLFSQDEAISQLSQKHKMESMPTNQDHPHVRRFLCDGVKVGFISPMTHSFCTGCNKLRLTPEGQLRMCLASENYVDLRSILRGPHTHQELKNAVLKAIDLKPKAAPWNTPGQMWKVGG